MFCLVLIPPVFTENACVKRQKPFSLKKISPATKLVEYFPVVRLISYKEACQIRDDVLRSVLRTT